MPRRHPLFVSQADQKVNKFIRKLIRTLPLIVCIGKLDSIVDTGTTRDFEYNMTSQIM